jgi:hypothetical protein
MSQPETEGHTDPTKTLTLNLDLHGFEAVDGVPTEVSAEIVRGVGGSYDLEIETSTAPDWRIELHVHPNGKMKLGDIFRGGSIVTADGDAAALADLEEWVQYVIRHVTDDVAEGV